MNPAPAGSDRSGLSGRFRGGVTGMLIGTVLGGACAFVFEALYSRVFYDYPGQDGAVLLFWIFLSPGIGAGALLGTVLGWRDASRGHESVPSPAGSDVAQRDMLGRLGWTVLGTMAGAVLFGAAALGLGLLYFETFPRVPDEGGSGYAIYLVVLPAGIVVGSVCGAAAGWLGSAPRAYGRVGRVVFKWIIGL